MKYTKEIKENIISDYTKGMLWDNLCKKYSTNCSTLYKIFNEYKIVRNRETLKMWNNAKKEKFKRMYLSNCYYSELEKEFNISGGNVTFWVNKLNLPKRGKGRNNVFHNYFSDNTVESNFWLGYIFADGNIYYTKRAASINLLSEKEYVITKFKEWFGNHPKVYKKNYTTKNGEIKTMYKASIFSREITSWFKDIIGICGKKHHTLNPNIELNWDILRGYFEGDGSASKGEFQLKSCSKVWLERIQNFLLNNNIESTLFLSYKDCYALCVRKKEELKKLVPLLYSNKYYCHEYKYKLLEPYIGNNISKPSELLED
jgi:hypothetical protein